MSKVVGINLFQLHLLPLAVALIIVATVVPAELRGPVWWYGQINPRDVAQNLLLYVPLGAALWKRGSLIVVAVAALLSGVIEVAQIWIIDRHPSPVDVASNAAGALFGAIAWRRAGLGPTLGPCTPIVSVTWLAALAAVAASILLAWSLPVRSSALSNWNPDYPLQIGNEASQDRPWRGVIHQLTLRPSATSSGQTIGPDAATNVIEIAGPIVSRGGKGTVIPGAASVPLAQAAMQHNSFTAVARVTTADIVQDGPARIVSFSIDPYHRNFDLGQQGRSVVFRIRTPVSGPNGENFRVETAPILRAGEETSIVASYDGAVARIHVNGRLHGRRNIAAAGCSIAALCDSAVPIAWAGLGAVATIISLALFPWATRLQAMGIAVLAALGALAVPRLLHVGFVPLATQPWAQVMALFGAGIISVAAELRREPMRAAFR